MQIVIGTNNHNKSNEIIKILESNFSNPFDFLTLSNFSQKIEVEETANSFAENAELKARGIYDILHIPVIADDSGLEVDILNGQPGIYSARFAGDNKNVSDNRKKLINELSHFEGDSFSAQFQCVICFFDGENLIKGFGTCHGKVILEERGRNGFGYDPLFVPEGYDKTFAELEPEIKNRISHRSQALKDFVNNFKTFLKRKN